MFYRNESGAGTIALVILALIAGYWIRSSGFIVRVEIPSNAEVRR